MDPNTSAHYNMSPKSAVSDFSMLPSPALPPYTALEPSATSASSFYQQEPLKQGAQSLSDGRSNRHSTSYTYSINSFQHVDDNNSTHSQLPAELPQYPEPSELPSGQVAHAHAQYNPHSDIHHPVRVATVPPLKISPISRQMFGGPEPSPQSLVSSLSSAGSSNFAGFGTSVSTPVSQGYPTPSSTRRGTGVVVFTANPYQPQHQQQRQQQQQQQGYYQDIPWQHPFDPAINMTQSPAELPGSSSVSVISPATMMQHRNSSLASEFAPAATYGTPARSPQTHPLDSSGNFTSLEQPAAMPNQQAAQHMTAMKNAPPVMYPGQAERARAAFQRQPSLLGWTGPGSSMPQNRQQSLGSATSSMHSMHSNNHSVHGAGRSGTLPTTPETFDPHPVTPPGFDPQGQQANTIPNAEDMNTNLMGLGAHANLDARAVPNAGLAQVYQEELTGAGDPAYPSPPSGMPLQLPRYGTDLHMSQESQEQERQQQQQSRRTQARSSDRRERRQPRQRRWLHNALQQAQLQLTRPIQPQLGQHKPHHNCEVADYSPEEVNQRLMNTNFYDPQILIQPLLSGPLLSEPQEIQAEAHMACEADILAALTSRGKARNDTSPKIKGFYCEPCARAFDGSSSLRNRVKKHYATNVHRENTFQQLPDMIPCPITNCGSEFNRMDNLVQHDQQVHSGQGLPDRGGQGRGRRA
ncbi:uncharacterized protein C8A04DRAFT_33250 [Dichotomopilus funicola]|uniref:C2H2-type domain-containing protein n=1 Tax=Dichotomopilus funicola TaxID=1934379 RepID=A0AAN6ZI46_9PEZI|nr:hypothetical protein C8A04DRAFT_33250 [Dichotomopilus funicola]